MAEVMQNERTQRLNSEKKHKERPQRNYWKWATLGIIGVLIGGVIAVVVALGQPLNTMTKPTSVTNAEPAVNIQLTKEKTNRLVNYFLDDYLKDSEVKYSFVLDNQAQLNGSFPFFDQDIPFTIAFSPEVQKNGDVLLRTKQLNVGRLKVPIGYVLSYVGKNYKLPKWVEMDSKKKTILLRLTDIKLERGLQLRATDIDLANDNINFGLYVPDKKG